MISPSQLSNSFLNYLLLSTNESVKRDVAVPVLTGYRYGSL
ncbi:Uncharacterised protein [Streptococcus acidominimus]|uniref:Uncharacterized protein n=1 Tax=Streptococcus acidominimus TaxID=1326 RepID=A0A380IEU4_STRAI|nr:Uncharacterised protein [Streptococcus acidominimus]